MKKNTFAALVFLLSLLGVTFTQAQAAPKNLFGPQITPQKFIDPVTNIHKPQAPAGGEINEALNNISSISQLDALRKPELYSKITQHVKAYKASVSLFDQTATAYLYWPDPAQIKEYVIAVVLPDKLTADKLFSVGSALDVGLNQPVLIWMKNSATLKKDKMPPDLKSRVDQIGMPGTVPAEAGFNLYGKIASGFIADLLKPAPVNLDPNNLFAGVAKIKEKGTYKVSLSIGSGTTWNNPFSLADTKITGATMIITTNSGKKSVEAWGTAKVKSKDFTFYANREGDGTSQSLGFDVKDASLSDFFMIVGVAGKTLKLPNIPFPSQLPLDMVTLENPAYKAYTDASSLLNFDTMMFKGTQKATGVGELIANTKGKVFKQPVAELKLKASQSGVNGAAGVAAKFGSLNAASANFYLNVGLPPSTPGMGIKAGSLLGDLDFQANLSGLKLDVPPKCPLQPLGASATLTDLSLTDLPIKFQVKDCATQAIKDVAKVAVAGGKLVADTGKQAGNAVVDAGKAVGGAASSAGKAVGGAASSVGNAAGGVAKKAKFW